MRRLPHRPLKAKRSDVFCARLLAASALMLPGPAAFAQTNPLDLVHPLIGTAADGQTFPATGVPFGMTQWTPQTRAGETKCVAPYYFADTKIQGFRGSHFLGGSCTQDYGSVTLMPLVSDAKLTDEARASGFQRSSEKMSPAHYSVDLADSGIHVEMTGSSRSGILSFTFPEGDRGWVAVENNSRPGEGTITIDEARQEITGENPVHRIYAGNGKRAGFSGYFVIQFDRPFHGGGTWSGESKHQGATSLVNPGAGAPGAYVSFELKPGRTVHARVGSSFTSIDQARANLRAEQPDWDFEKAVTRSQQAWTDELSRIEVGGSSPDKAIFYTALYHSMLLPREFSDVSGTYPRFAGGGATETAKGFTYYCDFSAWDTFRSLHPLLTIIEPGRSLDMVKSLIAKGEQGGFLPIFPAWNSYTSEMVGDHTVAIITDAYAKGIRGFDVAEAYRLMRKNATELPESVELYRDGRGRRGLESYLKYGYIPLEDHVEDAFHGDEQVSRTLEYAYDDFLVGEMAGWLGKDADARQFRLRAQNYKKVIDPATGFARGRHADGSWDSPFDPTGKYKYITEGLPYQYTFFVPQDVPGLIQLVGGPVAFTKKLDGLFAGKFYDHGNEPSHHIAYLYNFAGQGWKTQEHVHELMDTQYHDSPGGLAGNDDAGQMSAWYVMSALGIYPVTPGTPRYEIGTPRFDEITVRLRGGKKLHIVARGAEANHFYVRSVRLNGVPIRRHFLRQEEIVGGGELVFEMSSHRDSPTM